MTKDSGVHGIVEPDDATPMPGSGAGSLSTHVGTIRDLTAFYQTWMRQHDWRFDAANSTTNPELAVSKSLGYTSDMVWCRRTSPPTNASVIIGNRDGGSNSGGTDLTLIVMDVPDSTPCA